MILLKVTLVILIYCANCSAALCNGKTCAQCIRESVDCVWCPAANHTGNRCTTNKTVDTFWCNEEVYSPRPTHPLTITRNNNITAGPPAVQLAPQELAVSVRPRQTKQFTIKYKPAMHYPLDVYYLMDASFTMKDTIHLLQEQGGQIYTELSHFTNNVKMGIGSFIEKPGLPFADPHSHNSYAFKHHLNITDDRNMFKNVLNNTNTGANYEAPEAGLDALMQVMACKDRIGWRKHSRKIVVLCTDATYHSAGDGKIVGAAKLNDMECHLNEDGAYTLALEQDYPTVNQIRKIAKQENIIVIFNVKNRVIQEYEALAKRLDIAAEVIELKENSSITETLVNVYTKKMGSVQMDISSPDSKVRVTLNPDCTIEDKCKVKHDTEFHMQVSITADTCLNKNKNNTITIKPKGLDENVKIAIETLCECDCEEKPKLNAKECSSSGSLVCGICECNLNHFGDSCNCSGSSKKRLDECKANTNDKVVCSGTERGSCRCGICYCKENYSGKFCQFDDRACPKPRGKLCSGHGRCTEGQCKCTNGWTRDACECTPSDDRCRAPDSQKVCSDNGNCVCGNCNCTRLDSKNNHYFGEFCENCHDCDGNRCKELENYVLCVYTNETTKEDCDKKFELKNTNVFIVNKTEINSPKHRLAKRCKIHWKEEKYIIFKHKYGTETLNIIIQKDLEEPVKANIWVPIGSAIGAIILIGLLTLIIWKLAVDRYDAAEYARFQKLLDESGDLETVNALYEAPRTNVLNPLFNRLSRMIR
ncbi:integrin beta pat-3-like [Cydia pomonella]|uniref:integrin beta pat-3-like n=1 Tax=Cydia pomonella TaxID=82600 RepID=UPI002ADD46AF|nr:integrin beta pat-3-like [Cydia pomonella]